MADVTFLVMTEKYHMIKHINTVYIIFVVYMVYIVYTVYDIYGIYIICSQYCVYYSDL